MIFSVGAPPIEEFAFVMTSHYFRRLLLPLTAALAAAATAAGPVAAETPEQVTLPFSSITNPQSVVTDGSGNTYLVNGTDRGNDRVLRLGADGHQIALPFTWLGGPVEVTTDGSTTTTRGTSQLPGLEVDTAGNITAVVNCGTGSGCENPIGYKVVRLSPDGTQSTLPFTNIGGPVTQPLDVVVDGSGNTTITIAGAQPRVDRLSADGVQTTLPFTGLQGPYGLAVDNVGNTTVVDTITNRVVRVSPDGVQTTLPFAGLYRPTHVAVDDNGNTTVSDTGNNRVVRLDPDGVQTVLGFTGLDYPTGVAVDSAGNTTVADSRNNRVVRLTEKQAPVPTPSPWPNFGS
ncbi:hypothetical protein O4328_36840 [Rhodococcus opacus]|uniref:NHL repeat-containing protein n=1 Tax=Rhodococcus opacus TaxID=37919 RepID=A0ABT4NP57_RHOOP|nr:hypothetical protein [Rhodococcus opacus]MCZ4589156.1 hypothetical protein [Rhodococcus opacus]